MAVSITSREELAAWLEDKPGLWVQIILQRISLKRTCVFLDPSVWKDEEIGVSSALDDFRLNSQLHSQFLFDLPIDHRSISESLLRVLTSSSANSYVEYTLETTFWNVANSLVRAEFSVIWEHVSRDCSQLLEGTAPHDLYRQPVWVQRPNWFDQMWHSAAQWLSRPQDGFEIWREWYYGRLEGLRHAFADFDDAADAKFYRWIVEQDNDWWSREPAEVNAEIKAKVDSLRLPKPPTDSELQQEPSVVNYVVDEDGITQIAPEPLPNGVQDDQDNQDNYGEIKRLIEEALDECDPLKTQDRSMAPATSILQASLGSGLSQLSPRLFVLRAKELIRRFEARQAGEAMIPLSQGQIDAFSPLIDALKTLAEFDPKLSQLWSGSREGKASLTREQLETLVMALAHVKQMSPDAQQAAETYVAQVDSEAGPDDPDLKKANDNVGNAVKAMGKAVKKTDDAIKSADRAIRVAEKGSKVWDMVKGKIPHGESMANILEWLSKMV